MSLLSTKEIMEIIPHRQPMLLIDTVEEMEVGVRAVAKKCVSYNEPYFAGHFPGEPVMPGALIVEALAQTGAVALLTEEEQGAYRRGRNAHSGTVPKNAAVSDYRTATGFEALIGYLFLSGRDDRITELMKIAMEDEA